MSIDQAVLNRIWSQTLLEELARLGVQHVCVAPGSRSTPLTLEAIANPAFTLHKHFDERGLGFLALGLAKATGQPVAVIVTSGTAVANLLPAVAEAGLTGEKLVLLTADRPVELVDCGANQAIDQIGIFSSHVQASLNLPSPNLNTPLPWLLSAVDDVMARQASAGGAVHVNCAYPEPLYSDGDKAQYQGYLSPIQAWQTSKQPWTQRHNISALTSTVSLENALPAEELATLASRKGLVIIGSLPLAQAQAAQRFAHHFGWPVLCDPQSGVSSEWAHFDIWLSSKEAQQSLAVCDLVVQFGARLVSKRLSQWLPKHVSTGCAYWLIGEQAKRLNPSHLPQRQIVVSPMAFVDALLPQGADTLESANAGWANALLPLRTHVAQAARQITGEQLSELAIACDLGERAQGVDLMLGNSLFVRLADMFATLDGINVFTNRGASGIDGLFATAAGIMRSRKAPMLMMIGDTSALYDLNSLALFTHQTTPLVIVITNNDGGAIFDFLPVPSEQKSDWYQMPHGYQFEFAAKQFGLQYLNLTDMPSYQHAVSHHLRDGQGTMIIEVQTPPEQASNDVKAVMRACLHD